MVKSLPRKLFLMICLLLLLVQAGSSFAEADQVIYNRIKRPRCLEDYQFDENDSILHIWFPNVSNADAAILLYQDQVWLIDCGDEGNGKRTAKLLKKLGITEVHKLINSHPHYDHLLGMSKVLGTARIDELCICFSETSTDTMIRAVADAEEAGIPIVQYADGDMYSMGDGKVTLKFWKNDSDTLDMNNCSALAMLQYGDRRMLFAADLDRPGQAEIMTRLTAAEMDADILKYPHHGNYGLGDEFYAAVSPSLAIVTNDPVSDWGGIVFLRSRKIPYYYTSNGLKYVHLYTDGKIWVVEHVLYEKVTPMY